MARCILIVYVHLPHRRYHPNLLMSLPSKAEIFFPFALPNIIIITPHYRPGIAEEVRVGSLGCARGLSEKGCPMLGRVRDAHGSVRPPAWGQMLKAGQAYAGMN